MCVVRPAYRSPSYQSTVQMMIIQTVRTVIPQTSGTHKVDPAETRTPDPSNFRKEYEPGSNKNRIGRKSSARRSDPARLHSSRHLGWAMVGDAKSRKCKKAILQRIRSGRRGAQPTSAHSSPQPAQATHHVAQAQRRRQRFDLKHRK